MKLIEILEGGTFAADLEAELQEVARMVRETGKAGSVSCSVKITPKGSRQVALEPSLTAKPPKADREQTVVYIDEDGEVSLRDPRQPEIPGLRIMGGNE